eukprot:m.212411 g.212411  ORF g.212411 m.212411 type:complete len:379 (+) comp19042_c0_seq2:349-1485(+)
MASTSPQDITEYIRGAEKNALTTLRGKNLGAVRTLEVIFQQCEDVLKSVSKLDLAETNLKKIPVSVFRMEQLQTANFSHNNISTISEFCRWHGLRSLDLSHNQLSVIPVFLFQSTQLRKLVINGNRLRCLPMLPLTLSELDASDNELTDLGPTFRDLVKLRTCDLSKNKLVALRPDIFMKGQLPSLASLNVSHNEINDVPRALGALPSLVALNVRGNPMTNVAGADGMGTGRGLDLLTACASDTGPEDCAKLLQSVRDVDVRDANNRTQDGAVSAVIRPNGIFDGIMESIYTPGVNPGLIKAGWIVFVILFLFDIGLLIGLGPNLHVAIMFFLTCGVFGSLQWYITMLCEIQDEQDAELNSSAQAAPAGDATQKKKED